MVREHRESTRKMPFSSCGDCCHLFSFPLDGSPCSVFCLLLLECRFTEANQVVLSLFSPSECLLIEENDAISTCSSPLIAIILFLLTYLLSGVTNESGRIGFNMYPMLVNLTQPM